MGRPGWGILALAVLTVTASCQSSGSVATNRVGDCTFEPHTVCKNQNLIAVSLESSDLTGADFSGSDMTDANLRNAILRDAVLVGTNLSAAQLSGADLRGANLTNAALYRAHLDGADWFRSDRSGVRYCQTLLPDETISTCKALDVSNGAPAPRPSIVVFAASRPARCINDGIGQGINLDWAVRNASTAVFLVDDVHVSNATGTRGTKRIPFPCDGKPHSVTLQAIGATPPLAASSIVVSVPRP
jgi:hypothetical protein